MIIGGTEGAQNIFFGIIMNQESIVREENLPGVQLACSHPHSIQPHIKGQHSRQAKLFSEVDIVVSGSTC